MFVEKFQGDYKDGTQGTYDYRFLSGIYLLFRIYLAVQFHSSTYLNGGFYTWIDASILFFFPTLFLALVQPYKKRYMNTLESLIFAICWLINCCYIKSQQSSHSDPLNLLSICILAAIPMCAFILYSGYRCIDAWVRRCDWLVSIQRRCTARRQGSGEESEVLIGSFADRLQNPERYGTC